MADCLTVDSWSDLIAELMLEDGCDGNFEVTTDLAPEQQSGCWGDAFAWAALSSANLSS